MTKLSAENTAALIALIVHRSGQSRVRVSTQTLKVLSGRERFQARFAEAVRYELEVDHRLIMFELDIGGYAIVTAKAGEAAKAVTGKNYLSEEERRSIREGKVDWAAVWEEIPSSNDELDDD